jgi:hypothetical protein|tara:strand:- start:2283 stop:3476 length:1194 start_codon:yes stop_codon:yes gene_type:complete
VKEKFKQQYSFKVFSISISCIISFIVIEFFSRIFLSPPVILEYDLKREPLNEITKVNENRGTIIITDDPNPVLKINTKSGFRLKPNTHVIIENHYSWGSNVTIKTNSLGYRNAEIGPKDRRRILFLGDSITWGDWLEEDETFVHIVESLAENDMLEWETINAAVGGISLKNEIAILLETGLSTDPDAVVINFYLNDFLESPGVYLPRLNSPFNKSYFFYNLFTKLPMAIYQITGRGWRIRNMAFKELDLEELRNEFAEQNLINGGNDEFEANEFNQLVYDNFFDWGGSWSPEVWSYMNQLFRQLKDLSILHNFELYIVSHPVRYQIETSNNHNYPQEKLKQICSELDIPLLDLIPILKNQKSNNEKEIFHDHCHHTSYGNKLVANAIYNFLSKYSKR